MTKITKHHWARSVLNKRILAACDFYSDNESDSSWLKDLSADVMPETKVSTGIDNLVTNNNVTEKVNWILDALTSYATVFNVNVDSDHFITTTVAGNKVENQYKITAGARALNYRGRLACQNWSLIIASSASTIELFLIPTQQLLQLFSARFAAPVIAAANWDAAKGMWEYKQEPLHDFSKLCRDVFTQLVNCMGMDQNDVPLEEAAVQSVSASTTTEVAVPEPEKEKNKRGPGTGLLCAYITRCFSELIEEHTQYIYMLARQGVLCFRENSIDATEENIALALLMKRSIAALSSLKQRWEELAVLLLESLENDLQFDPLDQTYYCCKASHRLQTAAHILLGGVAEEIDAAKLQDDISLVEKLDELFMTLKQLKLSVRIVEQAAAAHCDQLKADELKAA